MDEKNIDRNYINAKREEFETNVHEPWILEVQAGVLKRAADCLFDRSDTTYRKLLFGKGLYHQTIEEV